MAGAVDRQLDLRGRLAVPPVALVQGVVRCLPPGRTLVVRCDRAATCRDLRAWATGAGLEVVAREGMPDDCRLYLRQPSGAAVPCGRGA